MRTLITFLVIFLIYNLIFRSSRKSTPKKSTCLPTIPPVIRESQIISKGKVYSSKNKLPDNLVITEEFRCAFVLMEDTNKSAYITGKAGTGKSTLLTYFRQKTKKNVIVLAPTGIAAINVEGSTVNSFFRFPPQLIDKSNITRDNARQDMFSKIDLIVVDEISMVRADMIDGIDYSLRINRKKDLPFGGVQMIFFGDLYQLPPVVKGKDLIDYFEEHYGGIYFFNAKVFKEFSFDYIELQKIFRQKDEHFKNILNSIREDRITAAELDIINQRFDSSQRFTGGDVSLTLSTTNEIANDINQKRMSRLTTISHCYTATITGRFDKSSYPTEPNLVLKKGAQIMMLKNDSQKRWVNGTLGIIKNLAENDVEVEIEGTTYVIEKVTWEVVEYQYNKDTKGIDAVVTGAFTQYPLKLAWAITIHKSQGQTLDNVIIDLGTGAFAHGQTYVALSRCKSIENITLKSKIRQSDIILDPRVAQFIMKRTVHLRN